MCPFCPQYPPSAAVSEKAHVKSMEEYQAMYKQSLEDPTAFWTSESLSPRTSLQPCFPNRDAWSELLHGPPPLSQGGPASCRAFWAGGRVLDSTPYGPNDCRA